MTSQKNIDKRKADYKRIKDLKKELGQLLWNVEEDAKNPSCHDWNAWTVLELQSLRLMMEGLTKDLAIIKNELIK